MKDKKLKTIPYRNYDIVIYQIAEGYEMYWQHTRHDGEVLNEGTIFFINEERLIEDAKDEIDYWLKDGNI